MLHIRENIQQTERTSNTAAILTRIQTDKGICWTENAQYTKMV